MAGFVTCKRLASGPGLEEMREGVAWSVFCVLSAKKPVRPPEELSQPGRYLDIPGGCRPGPSAGRTSLALSVPASRWRYGASSGEASDPAPQPCSEQGSIVAVLYLG
jgi:hypothetical protein